MNKDMNCKTCLNRFTPNYSMPCSMCVMDELGDPSNWRTYKDE